MMTERLANELSEKIGEAIIDSINEHGTNGVTKEELIERWKPLILEELEKTGMMAKINRDAS